MNEKQVIIRMTPRMAEQLDVAVKSRGMIKNTYLNAVIAAALSLEPACRKSVAQEIADKMTAEDIFVSI